MKVIGSRLHLRALAEDVPDYVADYIRNWVDQELRGREISERDTEIVVTIGMAVKE